MEKPKLLKSEVVYQGYITVKEELLEQKDGLKHPFSICTFPQDGIVVLAQTPSGHFVLNREYRHPVGEYILGCPAGSLKKDEDPTVAGKRELLEETGYEPEEIVLLGTSYPLSCITNHKIYYLWAKNVRPKTKPALEPFEFIQTELKTESEIRAEKTALDGHLLTALTFLKWHLNP